MTPAESQQAALNNLEQLSGKPVVLQDDARLPDLPPLNETTFGERIRE